MTRITELKEAELESRESRYYRDAGTCFVPGQRQRWWRPAQKAAVRAHRLTLQKAVWPLGTGLYSVGLLFLVASSGNNMFFVSCCCFCALPAGLERKHIFSVRFSRCWNISSFLPKNSPIWKHVYSGLHRHSYPPNRTSQKYPQYATSGRVRAFGWSSFCSLRSDEWITWMFWFIQSNLQAFGRVSSLQPVGSPEAKKQPKKTMRDNLMDGDNSRVCIRPLWHSNDLQ